MHRAPIQHQQGEWAAHQYPNVLRQATASQSHFMVKPGNIRINEVFFHELLNLDLLHGFLGVPKMTSLYSTWIVLDSDVHPCVC